MVSIKIKICISTNICVCNSNPFYLWNNELCKHSDNELTMCLFNFHKFDKRHSQNSYCLYMFMKLPGDSCSTWHLVLNWNLPFPKSNSVAKPCWFVIQNTAISSACFVKASQTIEWLQNNYEGRNFAKHELEMNFGKWVVLQQSPVSLIMKIKKSEFDYPNIIIKHTCRSLLSLIMKNG